MLCKKHLLRLRQVLLEYAKILFIRNYFFLLICSMLPIMLIAQRNPMSLAH